MVVYKQLSKVRFVLNLKINLNFHPLEAVSRYRDPQLQVGENYFETKHWQILILKDQFHSEYQWFYDW